MPDHRCARPANVLLRIRAPQRRRIGDACWDVAVQGIVRARLIRDDVDRDTATNKLGKNLCRVADDSDRSCGPLSAVTFYSGDSVVERIRDLVEEALRLASLGTRRIDLGDERDALIHRDGQGLRSAHAAEARGHDNAARQGSVEMPPRDRREGLVRALQDPLCSDVDPRPGSHLAVHRQSGVFQPPELVPRRPPRHDQRVRDEHARRPLVRAKDAHRFAGLHEEGLVLLQACERFEDAVERRPRASGAARSSIDDEVFRALGDVGVEVVLDHAEGGFLRPAETVQRAAARGTNDACGDGHGFNCPSSRSSAGRPDTAQRA